jgi:hypothetical protein
MKDGSRLSRVDAEGFDYQAEAYKTCSPHWNPQHVNRDVLLRLLRQYVDLCGLINIQYKLLLRGKTPDHFNLPMPPENASLAAHGGDIPPNEIDLIHGILGGASEFGELVEVAIDLIEGKPADRVNAIEEVGDMRWFLNLILRWAGCSDLECEMTNVDKLHGRHGSSFDIFRDAHRDLQRERARLEVATDRAIAAEDAPTLPLGPHGDEDEGEAPCPPHCCCCRPGDRCCDCGETLPSTHMKRERRPIGDVPGMDC